MLALGAAPAPEPVGLCYEVLDAAEAPTEEEPMTKNELIAAIADDTGKTKSDVAAILASLAMVVGKALKAGDEVSLSGVGKLTAAKRQAREARNPSTGATIKVPAKTVVKFKVTKDLAEAVA